MTSWFFILYKKVSLIIRGKQEIMDKKDDVKIIKSYWTKRALSYSEQNKAELECYKHNVWKHIILSNAPKKDILKVLDIGCGPGEFSIIMAEDGHDVTGVDITDEMLKQASENAKKYNVELSLKAMDVHNLEFEDDTFDLIISRNVTWNLTNPKKFFKECKRVLKNGGRMIYFDGNWYAFLYDEESRLKKQISDKKFEAKYGYKSDHSIDEIGLLDLAYNLPMSKNIRPQWDVENLPKFGLNIIKVDSNLNNLIWDEVEQLKYEATPMFMVVAGK